VRETRLLQIWTGTNDIQNLIIQYEFHKELLSKTVDERNIEEEYPPEQRGNGRGQGL